jgi:hypothetical protein
MKFIIIYFNKRSESRIIRITGFHGFSLSITITDNLIRAICVICLIRVQHFNCLFTITDNLIRAICVICLIRVQSFYLINGQNHGLYGLKDFTDFIYLLL